MQSFNAENIDLPVLQAAIPLKPSVLGIGLPEELADAFGLPPEQRVARGEWHTWLPMLPQQSTVLMWIHPRREDDQRFLNAVGDHFPQGATLWTFHAMGMLFVDRLTGDAVQTLLEGYGLQSLHCANTGFGYYARNFVRAPDSKPKPVPLSAEAKPKQAAKPVAKKAAATPVAKKKSASKAPAKKKTSKKPAGKKKTASKKTAKKSASRNSAAKKSKVTKPAKASKSAKKKKSQSKRR